MSFRNPWLLLAFVPLVFALARSYAAMSKGRYSAKIKVPWNQLWKMGTVKSVLPPRFWPLLFYGVAASFFILALARPQSSFHKTKRTIEGVDMMVVLDLSASMRIEDFRDQSRFDVAKVILRDFIAGRTNDKIGLETFSGEAVTLVPPTLDTSLVLQALRMAEIGDLRDGTAIGDALATAVGRLRESTAKSKVLVLVTDGDSNVGQVDPLTGGELAKGYGIRVYSIAIGREGRVAMPFVQKDVFGRQVKTYQYYDSSINPELLRQISSATGGKFYRVEGDVNVFRDVFADIDKLERTKIETTEQVRYEERFMPLVWCGLAMLLMGYLLSYLPKWRVYP
jgi:Ca-activated chloride channel family protein